MDLNVGKLRAYLVENGRFNERTIEGITFSYNASYALVKVRAPLKIIKNKMRQLNKKANGRVISFFERRPLCDVNVNSNEVLFVNNFDILDKQMHKRFTNLFLKYGELAKDITMGIDKNCDPFAIVHFRHCDDAQHCVQDGNIRFGGKKLSVNYSKRM